MIGKRGVCMRKVLIIIVSAGIIAMVGILVFNLVKTNRASDVLSIEKDKAKSLDMDIRFGAGKLLVEGGASEWVNGDIVTNIKKGYPTVKYKNKKNIGYAVIQQKKNMFSLFGKKKNTWNLQLTNEIPVDLNVQVGASDTKLNLAGINLSRLTVDAGVSDTTINLGGDWQESFDAEINLGVGDAKIYLPQGVGVKLSVSKGIGSIAAKDFISQGNGVYVNEAYDLSDTQINMEVNVGVGQVKFLLEE